MKPNHYFIIFLLIFSTSLRAQVKDINGKTYGTVMIGNQTWMAENLDVSKFTNGDTIPQARSKDDWWKAGEEGKPAWCYFNNDPVMGRMYGKLYNWFAVNDPRGLAPKGWHVASDKEWTRMTDYLGGDTLAGDKIKNITGWNETYGGGGPYAADAKLESGDGTNTSGFAALPGGDRNYAVFGSLGVWAFFWTSTEYDFGVGEKNTEFAYYRSLHNYGGWVYRANIKKWEGYSVRCVKD